MCDTTHKVFEMNPEIFKYRNIIVECTFLDDKTMDLAHESKHTHWKDLKEIIINHPHNNFILIHFSMRYSDQDILSLLEDKPQNVHVWLN